MSIAAINCAPLLKHSHSILPASFNSKFLSTNSVGVTGQEFGGLNGKLGCSGRSLKTRSVTVDFTYNICLLRTSFRSQVDLYRDIHSFPNWSE